MSAEANKIDLSVTAASAPRSKSRIGLVLGVAVLTAAASGGTFWLLSQRAQSNQQSQSALNANAPKYIVHLEGFTVNLADPEETHFLRVTMDLGIDRLPPGADKEKASAAMPVARIRDAILAVLTVCKADVLLTPEGKAQLKKNLLEALRREVPELDVRDRQLRGFYYATFCFFCGALRFFSSR
jgi:flagellar basal body-associated protein FliL